ncbi:MAG: MotA/TolQ/ExbB proton channel family protein [Cyanobacteria bacterium]|nr:MotA/TolQ/ExbB proton channel family protein [Cyanobacteriota bacterium]
MALVFDLLVKGGPVMWPLLGLSIATVTIAVERSIFWVRFLSREGRVVHDVLAAARYSLEDAAEIAQGARSLPIGRFLAAPLQLRSPSPETFRLALEASGSQEFSLMRRGDKVLETIVAIAPLLGLLGTVTGLINTFGNLNIGGGGTAQSASAAAAGIGEALLTTAFGMVVAIFALVVFRLMVILQGQQFDYFATVGSRLELIYRQVWYEPSLPENRDRAPIYPSGQRR